MQSVECSRGPDRCLPTGTRASGHRPDHSGTLFENDDKQSYYVAVDNGVSPSIRAFRVSDEQYGGPRQGQVVTVRATARLGRVRWIVRESDATRLGAP